MRSINYCIYKYKQRKKIIKKEFVDEYAFDLGYHQSYSIVILTLGLIFCAIVPLIAIFELFFFFLKYFIDKYNLTFVYNKEFEGGGIIKNAVIPFLLFSIFIFQILNVGYFYVLTGENGYWIGGMILLAIEIGLLCYLKARYEKKKGKSKK